jgi:thiazole synthase
VTAHALALRTPYLSAMTIVQTEPATDSALILGGRSFRSRLMVGTGKYRNNDDMVRAIEASGAEIVTVAVRRVDLDRSSHASILHHLSPSQYFLLANTAGCYSADEAIRYARPGSTSS